MVRLTVADRIARLTMARAEAGNPLDSASVAALENAFRKVERNPAVHVVVLDAEGETFSRGASKELLLDLADGVALPTEILLPRLLMTCPVPVIAAMAGHAVGGGFALGLAADVIIMSEESRYGFNFVQMGFTPGMGTTALCEHVLSPAQSHELLFTGELRRGKQFAGTGVNHVLPRVQVEAKAMDIAAAMAGADRAVLSRLKRTLTLPRRRAFEQSITMESLMHEVAFGSPSVRQVIEAGYVE